MEKLNTVYFSLSDKREFSEEEFKALCVGKTTEEAIVQFNLVKVVKMIVYGTLRYKDSAYNSFRDCYLLAHPQPVTIRGYHKIQPPNIPYPALEPCENGVVDAEMFYVYPDCLPKFDTYESVATGLYKRIEYEGAYLYVKGESYPG